MSKKSISELMHAKPLWMVLAQRRGEEVRRANARSTAEMIEQSAATRSPATRMYRTQILGKAPPVGQAQPFGTKRPVMSQRVELQPDSSRGPVSPMGGPVW